MPTGRQWFKFLSYSGLLVGSGFVFVNFFVPGDDKFLNELSPELKQRYYKEKAIRERAGELMAKRIEQTQDKPAWLQGMKTMNQLDRTIMEQARKEVEAATQNQVVADEKARLKELALKEKSM